MFIVFDCVEKIIVCVYLVVDLLVLDDVVVLLL